MVHKLPFLVPVFLLFVASSYAIPSEQVNKICENLTNPSLCVSILNSKPNANFSELTQYTIDIARVNLTNSIKLIKSLIAKSTNDTGATIHYTSCLEHFKDAVDDLEYTQKLFNKKEYQRVEVASSSIQDDVNDCIRGVSPPDPAFLDKSMLPQYGATINLVADIISILASYLLYHH